MPKQKIGHTTPDVEGFGRFDFVVGWNRDMSVQVGIETPDAGGAGTGQRHLVDFIYGDQSTEIGKMLRERLQLDTAEGAYPATDDVLGRIILDCVTGSTPFGTSVWWHPDRQMINKLIRTLRLARDQAYGKDA